MAIRIEWHPAAVEDLRQIGLSDRSRIRKAIDQLSQLDDARQRLLPYSASLKGYWKLRGGDYRLVCRLTVHDGREVLIVLVAHRSVVYSPRWERTIHDRGH
ncbi:MAG: type II toxin-antitoxin system RelE/ParE family toxin [Mesorhizobium sp.]|nr:type II toxin-antitoxin system RelE/ParE family toxin [Mesorhizobium sp.]